MYLKFNNIDLTELIILTGYNINLLPVIDESAYNNRVLTIDYVIVDNSEDKLIKLANALDTNFEYKELFFNTQSYYYNAKVSNTSLNHLRNGFKQGSIEFNIKDNFRIKKATTIADLTITNNKALVDYKGTAKTYPKFEITFNNDASYLQILNKQRNSSLKLGAIKQIEDINENVETTIINTKTFDGFRYNNLKLMTETGAQQGLFQVTENGLSVSDYYDFQTNYYYGPSYSKDVEPILNFKSKIYLDFSTLDLNNQKNNRLEFLTNDELGDLIAGIQITSSNNQNINSIILKTKLSEITISTEPTNLDNIEENIEYLSKWNNFKGYFEIEKIGDFINFRITKLNKAGNQVEFVSESLSSPIYKNQKLKRLGIWMAKFRNNNVLDTMAVKELNLIKYSQSNILTSNLFKKGSKLSIDNEKSKVFLDSIERLDIIDVSNIFFEFKNGENELLILSDDSQLSVKTKFNEKYLF